ncbi:MAG: hypothetical protein J6T92_00455, partial [Ottowia sp.]|nr:hypothetical protein [Ottowia sp.]
AKDKEGHDALWHARHPDMVAGASEADLAEIVRLLQGGSTKKPAAQDAGDFSAADLKRMSTFVSEVTEVFPWDFDMRKKDGDRPDLSYFGVAHNFIHNRASRVKPCPKKGCKYGNAVMEAKFVAETARKYFDLEVKHHSTTDSDSPAPVHFDGRLYHFDTNEFIDDESPAVYYAEVTRAVREGGVIRMTGNIYEGRNAGEPPRITDFFVVTAKPHKWNGEDTWAILSLMTEDR